MKITASFALLFSAFFAVSLIYFLDVRTGKLRFQLDRGTSFVQFPVQKLRAPSHRDANCLVCD